MAATAPLGWVDEVERVWVLGPFARTLQRRARERTLLEQLWECVGRLWSNPRGVGLGVEQLRLAGRWPVLSARISLQFRLILVQLGPTEVGLLHFDNHDEAYAWVDRNASRIPAMLARVAEVPRSGQPGGLVPVVRADQDAAILLRSREEFSRMLAGGVERYLAYLDDEQRRLVGLAAPGLLLVKGGAGTGKTAVGVHRVAGLLRQPDLLNPRPVLYLCYNNVLVSVVHQLLDALFDGQCPPPSPSGAEVSTLHNWCKLYLESRGWRLRVVEGGTSGGPAGRDRAAPADADDGAWHLDDSGCEQLHHRLVWPQRSPEERAGLGELHPDQVWREIVRVVRGAGLATLEEYVAFNREGCGFGLKRPAREAIWSVHERLARLQRERRALAWADLPILALRELAADAAFQPYRAVVVDEGQDFGPLPIRLASRLAGLPAGSLTVLADAGQDIYESGHAWAERELRHEWRDRLTVRWLHRSYRNPSEVFALARSLLEPCPDAPTRESLRETQAPERSEALPTLVVGADVREEVEEVCRRVVADLESLPAECVAVVSPTRAGLTPYEARLRELGVPHVVAFGRSQLGLAQPAVKLTTVASAKGLDFPLVYLVRLTRGAFGRASEVEARRHLYVALTRASRRLTLATVEADHHPLLETLPRGSYEPAGSRGREFANLYGR